VERPNLLAGGELVMFSEDERSVLEERAEIVCLSKRDS